MGCNICLIFIPIESLWPWPKPYVLSFLIFCFWGDLWSLFCGSVAKISCVPFVVPRQSPTLLSLDLLSRIFSLSNFSDQSTEKASKIASETKNQKTKNVWFWPRPQAFDWYKNQANIATHSRNLGQSITSKYLNAKKMHKND